MSDDPQVPPRGFAALGGQQTRVELPPAPPTPAAPPPRPAAAPAQQAKPGRVRGLLSTIGVLLLVGLAVYGWALKAKDIEWPWNDVREEQPPVGSGLTLSAPQIRYCVSEKIRLEGWQSGVDPRTQASIDAFNNGVDDYNSRCSQFRYKRGRLESVRDEVEPRRAELLAAGKARATVQR